MEIYCRKCRNKNNILNWKQSYGMMLIDIVDGKHVYTAKCPKCGIQYIPIEKAKQWAKVGV